MFTFRSILCPTDLQPDTAPAFDAAVALARLSGGTVHALFVVLPPAVIEPDGKLTHPNDPALAAAWDELKARVATAGVPVNPVVLVSEQANAVAKILATVDTNRVDVIVMATHGRTGLGRLLWGSVAEETVRMPSPRSWS